MSVFVFIGPLQNGGDEDTEARCCALDVWISAKFVHPKACIFVGLQKTHQRPVKDPP